MFTRSISEIHKCYDCKRHYFHLNSIDDPDATTLKDNLGALGLKIHKNFPKHRHQNTLDILAIEIAGSLNIIMCQPGPFLSDHCSIECTTDIKR